MVQVKKRYLYLLDLLVCACLLVLGITYYVVSQTLNIYGDLSIKYQAENILYLTIVFIIVINLYFAYMMRRSKKLLKDLDKVIELTKYGRHDISEFVKRWGQLGEKINFLVYQLHHLSELQALKISGLSHVVNLLFEHTKASLLLVDTQGKIINASAQLASDLVAATADLVDRHVGELTSALNYESIFQELERIFSPLTKEGVELDFRGRQRTVTLSFFPVLNSANQVTAVLVAVADDNVVLTERQASAAAATPGAPVNGTVHHGLLDFFQKKFEKLVPKKAK